MAANSSPVVLDVFSNPRNSTYRMLIDTYSDVDMSVVSSTKTEKYCALLHLCTNFLQMNSPQISISSFCIVGRGTEHFLVH